MENHDKCVSSVNSKLWGSVCSVSIGPEPACDEPGLWPALTLRTVPSAEWAGFDMKPNHLHGTTMGPSVIKCQQRSRLNEQSNDGNEWECFLLKSLINLTSHQPLSAVTPSSLYRSPALLSTAQGPFILWPCVPGAINPVCCPRAASCVCVLFKSRFATLP